MDELILFFDVDLFADDFAEIIAASDAYNRINVNKLLAPDPVNEAQFFFAELVGSDWSVAGYQNADYIQPTTVYFDEWQWDEPFDDEWQEDQAPQAAVSGMAIDDAWDWDEHAAPDLVITGYQNADAPAAPNPLLCQSHEWDWDEVLLPDVVPTSYQNADVAVVASAAQQPQEDWDFASDFGGEDGWSNHFTNYDASSAYDLDWDWDECVFGEFMVLGYQQADAVQAAPPPAQPPDHEWDWSADIEDEWQDLTDDTDDAVGPNAPVNFTLCSQDQWWADEYAEDDWQEESAPVGAGYIQPRPTLDDAWDWDEWADDEWEREDATAALSDTIFNVLAQSQARTVYSSSRNFVVSKPAATQAVIYEPTET